MSRNTSEQEQSSPNFLKRKIAAAAVLTGLSAAALTGCAPGQAEGQEPAPTSTSSEAPTTEETQAPVETTPELVTSYDKLNYADFETKEQTSRRQYVDYDIDLEENQNEHESLLSSFDRPSYVELTKDSSPQDIYDHFTYISDQANYQWRVDAATGNKLHDVDSGIKLMSGMYFAVGEDGVTSNAYKSDKQRHLDAASDSPFVSDSLLTATGTSGVKEGEINGVVRTYQDIEGFTNKGTDASGRWFYVEYSDILTGETEGTWLLDQYTGK